MLQGLSSSAVVVKTKHHGKWFKWNYYICFFDPMICLSSSSDPLRSKGWDLNLLWDKNKKRLWNPLFQILFLSMLFKNKEECQKKRYGLKLHQRQCLKAHQRKGVHRIVLKLYSCIQLVYSKNIAGFTLNNNIFQSLISLQTLFLWSWIIWKPVSKENSNSFLYKRSRFC